MTDRSAFFCGCSSSAAFKRRQKQPLSISFFLNWLLPRPLSCSALILPKPMGHCVVNGAESK